MHLPQPIHNEQELLQQLAAGNQQAFNRIYDLYHHGIYLNVLRSVRNATEAEDIVQDVFFTLWQKRATIAIERSIGGWLFTSSYNRTVDLLRKKTYEAAGLTEIALQQLPLEADAISKEQQHILLQQAIRELSPQKRRVFELCKLQQLSYEKAATELGISKYTVGEYLKEAMAFIRQYVQQHPQYATGCVIGAGVLASFLEITSSC